MDKLKNTLWPMFIVFFVGILTALVGREVAGTANVGATIVATVGSFAAFLVGGVAERMSCDAGFGADYGKSVAMQAIGAAVALAVVCGFLFSVG